MILTLEKPVEVKIWGHEALITSVYWRLKLEPWYPEDLIHVLLDLPKSPYAVSGFGIYLPVKDYGKAEFLQAVIEKGEEELKSIAARRREEIEERKKEEEREKELGKVVQNIITQLSSE